jgi:hypothetical protein
MSKLAELEGEWGDCYKVHAWAKEASRKDEHQGNRNTDQRSMTDVMKMYACLSDRVSPSLQLRDSFGGGARL